MVITVRVGPHNASRKTLSELEGAAKFCAPLTAAWIFLSHLRINLPFNASDTHAFPINYPLLIIITIPFSYFFPNFS